MKKLNFLFAALAAPLALSAYCPCPYCPEEGYYQSAYYDDEFQQGPRNSEEAYYYNAEGGMQGAREDRRGMKFSERDRFVTESDQDLLASIRETIGDKKITANGDNLYIMVDHGTVTFFGRLDNESEKRKIQDAVSNLDGVRNVSFRLDQRGQRQPASSYRYNGSTQQQSYRNHRHPYYVSQGDNRQNAQQSSNQQNKQFSNQQKMTNSAQSDNALKVKIENELTNTWFAKKFEDVTVNVSNGTITLKGTVETNSDLQEVEKRVKNIAEGRNINNQIQVKSSTTGTSSQSY